MKASEGLSVLYHSHLVVVVEGDQVEVVVSSLAGVLGVAQKVAWGAAGPSFQGGAADQEVQ